MYSLLGTKTPQKKGDNNFLKEMEKIRINIELSAKKVSTPLKETPTLQKTPVSTPISTPIKAKDTSPNNTPLKAKDTSPNNTPVKTNTPSTPSKPASALGLGTNSASNTPSKEEKKALKEEQKQVAKEQKQALKEEKKALKEEAKKDKVSRDFIAFIFSFSFYYLFSQLRSKFFNYHIFPSLFFVFLSLKKRIIIIR